MRKLLLICLLLTGVGIYAQYDFTADFETYPTNIYKDLGGGSQTAAASCTGQYGGQLTMPSSMASTAILIDMGPTGLGTIGQKSNGQKINVKAKYKKPQGLVGLISLAYFIKAPGSTTWTSYQLGDKLTFSSAAITDCTELSGTVPVGYIQPDAETAVGVLVTRTAGSGDIYVDDIEIKQEVVNTPPAECTTVLNPLNGSTITGGTAEFKWTPVPLASKYKVTIGTTPGGSDVYSAYANTATKLITLPLQKTLYAKIIPANEAGEATGCSEFSFTTNDTLGYCPIGSTTPDAIYPISSVSFNGKANTSTEEIGQQPVYEDFSNVEFEAAKYNSYPLTIKGPALAGFRFGATVFIDWNSDADFDDEGEQLFTTPETFLGGVAAINELTGMITVPDTAPLGKVQMRIKYNYNSSSTTLNSALRLPCGAMSNGQVEDYTLVVKNVTGVASCSSIISPANDAAGLSPNVTVKWNVASGAAGYKLYIGKAPGQYNVANGIEVKATSYTLLLDKFTKYYAKVVPYNQYGTPEGCQEMQFTTGDLAYCAAAATSTTSQYEKISRVRFADLDNPSKLTDGYENFLDFVANVKPGEQYPITVDIANVSSLDKVLVWIDYDQNGIFGDANETTALTVNTAAKNATGKVTIPPDAKIGKTRMRVRLNYNTVPSPCGSTTYGQVEDYSVSIANSMGTADAVEKTEITPYPNPFSDFLKISDIKNVKTVLFTDLAGRLVKALPAKTEINVSDLKPGLYLVTLKMKDGTSKTFKAIKK